ncbi:MAG: hypothetical protein IPI29_00005 [Ignavibacteria bacterium]|nr:hypothetical protein [Ignavibacteria bacterium]
MTVNNGASIVLLTAGAINEANRFIGSGSTTNAVDLATAEVMVSFQSLTGVRGSVLRHSRIRSSLEMGPATHLRISARLLGYRVVTQVSQELTTSLVSQM